jgi:1-acyl-sn-glycerol-3-phosphate acyltransferase
MLLSLFVFAIILVLALPASLILIPFTLIARNVGPLYATGCFIVRVAMRAAGIRIQVQGQEKIPSGRACIFMANHVSNLDPPVLIPNLPGRTSIFLKRDLMKIPILGYAFKLAHFIPVDRDGLVESAQSAQADAHRVLAAGMHITTFVEGKRSTDGRLLPFKKGPFYLAKESGALCVPISIYGTESIIPWGSLRIYPGTAHVVFHEPVDPAHYATRDELSDAVRAAIASSLPAWMRTPLIPDP